MRKVLVSALAAAAVVVLAIFWPLVATQSQGFFGFNAGSGNGSHYLFFSGAGSDLAYLSFLWAGIVFWRKNNCEVHHCWRLGRHDTAAGHTVCRKHHPDGHLTVQDVAAAHEAAKAARRNPFAPAMERLKRKDDQ